jgi:hypothetical protein
MLSCPITAQLPKPSASEFPVIVQANNTIKIYLSKDNAILRLWTVTGILIQTAKPKDTMYIMPAPSQKGSYLLEIFDEESRQRTVLPLITQ